MLPMHTAKYNMSLEMLRGSMSLHPGSRVFDNVTTCTPLEILEIPDDALLHMMFP